LKGFLSSFKDPSIKNEEKNKERKEKGGRSVGSMWKK
jgi:hypothetical protein